MSHTPGPWTVATHMGHPIGVRLQVADGRGHCYWIPDNEHYPTRSGDFPLIATSPDLLAACKATCATIERYGRFEMETAGEDGNDWRKGVEPHWLRIYDQNAAAIARACGQEV